MPNISIIQTQINGTEVVTLDITENYGFTYPSKVTAYPIESGETISDHVIDDQFRLVIEGLVSDSHIAFSGAGPGSRTRSAYDALVRIRNSKTPFRVVTFLNSFDNMLFTNLEFNLNPSTGFSLPIKMEMVQVMIVAAQSVAVPPISAKPGTGTSDRGASKTNAGSQPGAPTDKSVLVGNAERAGVDLNTIIPS